MMIWGWGQRLRRTYRLHWSEKVTDHLTSVESTDATAVLDGELDEFLESGRLVGRLPKPRSDSEAATPD